jgi:uncharacterized protein (DUF1778 family)
MTDLAAFIARKSLTPTGIAYDTDVQRVYKMVK